jgi:putative DNA primase/helicase
VALLILDPVTGAIGTKTNSHNNAETRNSLQPIVDFAEAANSAVLGVTHLTKGTAGRNPTERITGSLAFGAVARIVMLAAMNNADDGPPRILTRAKNNLGLSGGGFGYDIEPAALPGRPTIIATAIVWGERIIGTAKKILAKAEGDPDDDELSKLAQAEEFLGEALTGGERSVAEVIEQAALNSIKEKTLRRAAKDLKVVKQKHGLTGGWF